jgi:hypothetical protein
MRWVALVCGVLFSAVSYLRGETADAAIAFVVGMIGGFLFDCAGVGIMRLWHYSRQPFLGIKYFAIVVPAWGVFGMMLNLPWNWFNWIGLPGFVFLALTVVLFAIHELPNFKTKSWRYNAPMWLVGLGWFPMIILFRLTFIVIR